MKKIAALLIVLTTLAVLTFPLFQVRGQGQGTITTGRPQGLIVQRYRENAPQESLPGDQLTARITAQGQNNNRPAWVEAALGQSHSFLAQAKQVGKQGQAPGNSDPGEAREEFRLLSAEQDDLGQTHVRLNQFHQGVPVFGGQLITHVVAGVVAAITGKSFDVSAAESSPVIGAGQAIVLAQAALAHTGELAADPAARLVILPSQLVNEMERDGGTLVYQVELRVEDGSPLTGHHQYFIAAQDGRLVWYYNSLPTGIGRSIHSGTVEMNTSRLLDTYSLILTFRSS